MVSIIVNIIHGAIQFITAACTAPRGHVAFISEHVHFRHVKSGILNVFGKHAISFKIVKNILLYLIVLFPFHLYCIMYKA